MLGIICLAAFAIGDLASAESYYVANQGDDSAAGTVERPFRTIQRAVNQAREGDTVLITQGEYPGPVRIRKKMGTPGRPIVLKMTEGARPIIEGAKVLGNDWTPLVHLVDSHYIRIEGLEIRNSPGQNVLVEECTHIELINLETHGARRNGGIVIRDKHRPNRAAFNKVRGCKSHHNYRGGIAIEYSSSGYHLIENNEVFLNQGVDNYDGIQVGSGSGGCHHVVVRNNLVYDNGNARDCMDQIDAGGHGPCDHYLVEGNEVFCSDGGLPGVVKVHGTPNSSGKTQVSVPPPRSQITRFNRLTNAGFSLYSTPCATVWYHNTVVGKGMGVCVEISQSAASRPAQKDGTVSYGDETFAGGDTGRLNFKNNLFYQLTGEGNPRCAYLLQLSNGDPAVDLRYSSLKFQNNLYRFAPMGAMIWRSFGHPGAPATNEVNLGPRITQEAFLGYQQSNQPDLPDLGSRMTIDRPEKVFLDYIARNYRLMNTSPAVDAGAPLTKALTAGDRSRVIQVDRATYFQDGYAAAGASLIEPDSIKVGANDPVRIAPGGIDEIKNEIRLVDEISWNAGDPVSLPYLGKAPDIGAYEFVSAEVKP